MNHFFLQIYHDSLPEVTIKPQTSSFIVRLVTRDAEDKSNKIQGKKFMDTLNNLFNLMV